ncbi:hypothetical protein VB620_10375 [Nodularia harveyana UHCC-0300]|uniref:Uncharacterized protein n=1 Tax=Nodularia harveyana UHCC-0300 TaxID=2974287 RepID=A0ABU5UDY4_9CYAN|nr:hypothetical protein [Nodularia harveyana]MEA5581742.1 hypothetical protein [Nodularia harveyana UHCC-0300]
MAIASLFGRRNEGHVKSSLREAFLRHAIANGITLTEARVFA